MFVRALIFTLVLAVAWTEVSGQCQGSATYLVSNVCTWTSSTHPTDYPDNAHFSPLCGTTHNNAYNLFRRGDIATDGLRQVAEIGACGLLLGEIDMCVANGNCPVGGFFSKTCDTSMNAPGVGNGVCTHSVTVTVTPNYPYVSMVSMIAPSPDWFVGVSGVNLCVQDGLTGNFVWVDQYPPMGSRNLNAYDAGTDSGVTFKSPNEVTSPQEPISVFDAMNASNIFYNQATGTLNPLCRLQLVRT